MKGRYRVILMNNKIIPIFFACDNGFINYTSVSLKSLMMNADKTREYSIHILNTGIDEEKKKIVLDMADDTFHIFFDDVTDYLKKLESRLPLRDYYSSTTYYRLFLAEMFPEYEKAVYIDSDTVVLGNIAELYDYDIGDNYVGAVCDPVISQTEIFADYAEQVLDIDRNHYFNAGVLVLNISQFREQDILGQFIDLLHAYTFVVAQDQDYLNIICKNHVYWLDPKWNTETFGKPACEEEDICLIHYNLAEKPWHYEDCRLANYFWRYAKETPFYSQIMETLRNFTDEDEKQDKKYGENLYNLAYAEINNENNYKNMCRRSSAQSEQRRKIVEKIEKLEREGHFDVDVEDDPPSRVLMPDEIDYTSNKLLKRFRTKYAFRFARWYLNAMIYEKKVIFKEFKGVENFNKLNSGAIITCNHFNAYDSFAMEIAYEKALKGQRGTRKLYRIIKEGNYTSFPGFYGFLMRNCNTLPLSSNMNTMKKFVSAVDKLLSEGNFILIYPEQSMWWNYRKPKPLKKGAYKFAAKNNVPVLPCFITMEDSNIIDSDGFPVQEYTIHVASPIYPDASKSERENVIAMMKQNYNVWKEIYESTYGVKLSYTCGSNYKDSELFEEIDKEQSGEDTAARKVV